MVLKKNRDAIILFFGLLALWEICSSLRIVDIFLFPTFSSVIGTGLDMIKTGELWHHVSLTVERLLLGFLSGASLGLLIGSLCGISKRTARLIEPLFYIFYTTPKFALLPFIILIFGFGMAPKVIFVGMGAFFPVAVNMISGIRSVQDDFLEIATHYGARGWRFYKRVLFPGSLPYILAGLRISMGLSLTYVIIIEFLTASDGIGSIMWLSLQTLNIKKMVLGILIVAILSFIFISLIRYLETFLLPWKCCKEEEEANT